MNGILKSRPMAPAVLLSLVLHGAMTSVLVMAGLHRAALQPPQVLQVTLADWPRERSVVIPHRTEPSRPNPPAMRPQSHSEDLEPPPPATPEVQATTESHSVESASPTASTVSSRPVSSQSPAAFALTPPQFDPAYRHNPKPDYPVLARKLGLQGTVVLRVLIGIEGRPGEIHVEKSSGHAVLDEAARAAVKQWLFEPAREGDMKIAGWVDVPIQFRLE